MPLTLLSLETINLAKITQALMDQYSISQIQADQVLITRASTFLYYSQINPQSMD